MWKAEATVTKLQVGYMNVLVGKNPRGEEQPIPRGAIRMEHNKYVKQRKCLIAGYPHSSAEHKGL